MKGNIVRQILSDQANKNTRGNTRLNAAEIENEQFYFIYETKIFNSTLKKVPEQVESRAWAPLVTFFKRNIKNWSQSRDLTYDGDAISVNTSHEKNCWKESKEPKLATTLIKKQTKKKTHF